MYSHLLWGTQLRQQHLKDAKYFNCNCERCTDPTELGTYFSAMKCLGVDEKGCDGIHLPENPLSDKTEWACNKCPMKISNEQVMFITSKMGEEIDTVLLTNPSSSLLEALIEKLSQFLHPNHYHLFALKHTLIQLYDEKISNDILSKKFELCDSLLFIVDKLDPFSIRVPMYTAIILYEKFNVIMEQMNRKINVDLMMAMKCLERARDILVNELDVMSAKQLHDQILSDITNIERVILTQQLSNTKI
jgi:hypothetical protein